MQSNKYFRAWDKLEKRYIYSDTPNQQHYILTLDGKFYNLQNGSGGDDYVVEQWTGLVDNQGVKIYEGDILRTKFWQDAAWHYTTKAVKLETRVCENVEGYQETYFCALDFSTKEYPLVTPRNAHHFYYGKSIERDCLVVGNINELNLTPEDPPIIINDLGENIKSDDFMYADLDDFEKTVGYKVNNTFKDGWTMARLTWGLIWPK